MSRLYKATILLVFLVPVALGQCEPDCTGHTMNDLVADPLNCTNYYICIADGVPTDAPLSCPAGDEFDTTTSTCTTPAATASPCTASCELPDCHLTCDPTLGFEYVRDPLDCSVGYVCSFGELTAINKTCDGVDTGQLYFDGTRCVDDPTVCCGDPCIPYCYTGVVQAPDPYDCTAFYICLDDGLADANNHNKCPANHHFDIPSQRCVDGAECSSLCTDGGNNQVTITPTDGGNTDGTTAVTLPSTTTDSSDTTTTTTDTTTTTTDTTTTTTDTTTTTTATTDPGGCVEEFNCTSHGAFPQCEVCDSGYFVCEGPGAEEVLHHCPSGYVFNTNPDQPICVPAASCPYYPTS